MSTENSTNVPASEDKLRAYLRRAMADLHESRAFR